MFKLNTLREENRYLTLSQTIPDFHGQIKERFKKYCGKRRQCFQTYLRQISSFK